MGLKNVIVKPVLLLIFVGLVVMVFGCAMTRSVTPAENVKNDTFWYDCCNPGLASGTKEMCDLAKNSPNHTLKDEAGNKYKFIWSDCEIGKEPWQDFEDSK